MCTLYKGYVPSIPWFHGLNLPELYYTFYQSCVNSKMQWLGGFNRSLPPLYNTLHTPYRGRGGGLPERWKGGELSNVTWYVVLRKWDLKIAAAQLVSDENQPQPSPSPGVYQTVLSPSFKYAHNTWKTKYFLHANFYISLIQFFDDHSFKNFWLVPKIVIWSCKRSNMMWDTLYIPLWILLAWVAHNNKHSARLL